METSTGFINMDDTRYLSFLVGFYSNLTDFILYCQYFLLALMPAVTFILKHLILMIIQCHMTGLLVQSVVYAIKNTNSHVFKWIGNNRFTI